MYPVNAATITAYESDMNAQARMSITPTTGSAITVTNADIVLGSLRVSRSCSVGEGIGFGAVTASQLRFSLMNYNGQFSTFKFAGAKIFLRLNLIVNGAPAMFIPMGYYTIDSSPKIRQTIDIEALDRMALFDKTADPTWFTFPMRTDRFITILCAACNVALYTDVTLLSNAAYQINGIPENVTCRQLLSWACEITGTNAYFDWNGQLRLEFYSNANYITTQTTRFESETEDCIVTYTGVTIENGEISGSYGAEGYVYLIEGNDLIDHDLSVIAASLLTKLQSVPYVPHYQKIMPAPYLYPMDILTYKVDANTSYTVVVTDAEYTLGGLSLIEGKGESPQVMSYAAVNPFTSSERRIIKTVSQDMNETLNSRVQSVIDFNNLITNSLGLYYTDITNADGSVTRYMHDQPVLNDSMQIYTLTANGIAWTDTGWNGGSPVWQYGVTTAGFALFKRLSAEGIDVQSVNTNYHVEITPSAFKVYYLATEVMSIVADELTVPKAKIEALDLGGLRFVAVKSGSTIVGTDVYWIGG